MHTPQGSNSIMCSIFDQRFSNIISVILKIVCSSFHLEMFQPASLFLFFLRVKRLRGRRLNGKGKGVLGARETRVAHEEEGKETPARRPLFFSLLKS